MKTFLAIDTISVPFSIAIGNQESVLAEEILFDRMALAGQITLMVDRCCKKAGLDLSSLSGILISKGPGSYTGLRIGYSIAKGLCMAMSLPLIEVDPMMAMAFVSMEQTGDALNPVFCSALDARRNEVYLAIYNKYGREILKPQPCILPIELKDLIGDIRPDLICCSGDGALKLEGQLGDWIYRTTGICSIASYLFKVMDAGVEHPDFDSIASAEPLYLKPPNITISKKKMPGGR